ncbi:Prostaglandin E synthase 3 [Dissostichus eleginoides]|uniref:Prostaglandin E synthase 3 n=1 Tax=Dissostichus eleginoides TaxID=100907 RepID=A0AAD9BI85_DISEL|nr:Prostaglandin E synthase 3 [Dissostichus eleginoides]
MNKITIVRPEESQPARAVWYDRKKYVTVTFIVHKPKDVQVDIQPDKMILYCKNDTDDVFYNVLPFYENIEINDSRERVYDRSIHILLRKIKPDYSWPRLQKDEPSWISVDFDNWRDWENEVEDGKEEFDMYADMIKEMSSKNKGEAPDMDDLDSD